MTGGLWALRGNEWTRSAEQLELRRKLVRAYPVLGRAIALREALQGVLADGDLPSIRWWLGWADRSRLEPFRKLSRTLKEHFHGILAYLDTRLTSAAIEAVNSLLQMAKRIARGFRNFHYFRLAAYLKASHLKLRVFDPYALETSKRTFLSSSSNHLLWVIKADAGSVGGIKCVVSDHHRCAAI